MKIEFLPWDSDFFGCKIGRAEVAEAADVDAEELDRYDLVYVFTAADAGELLGHKLQNVNAVLLDTRVVLRKPLSPKKAAIDDTIRQIAEPSGDLERLAWTSGWCSRFHQDQRLLPKYQALYSRWMMNYLDKTSQKVTFAAFQDDEMAGMINCGVERQNGRIGLLAVGKNFRGRGIAGKLLAAADVFCAGQGASSMEVATQKQNASAIKTYLKANYQIISQTNIWHRWKNE